MSSLRVLFPKMGLAGITFLAVIASPYLAAATPVPEGEPGLIPVSPLCNMPNNVIPESPDFIMPGIPPPPASFKLQQRCCYEKGPNISRQVCACKAWDAWCKAQYSGCCGDVRACTEYCICVPPERFCDHPDVKYREVCADPYKGEGDVSWVADLPFGVPPKCPGDH